MLERYQRDSLFAEILFSTSRIGRSLKEQPLGFYDIGARGGAHDIVDPIASLVSVVGFEPDKNECDRIKNSEELASRYASLEVLPVALSDDEKQVTLHLVSSATNHSLLPPNVSFVDRYNMNEKWTLVGIEQWHATTLDRLIFPEAESNREFVPAEFLKIDTQGTEFEILSGARRTLLEQTVAVVTEVSFAEIYEGQKLFSEVELLMRDLGFTFYGFSNGPHSRSKKVLDKRHHVTAERIMYADAVFFKDPLKGTSAKSNKEFSFGDRQCFSLFTVAVLLGYYDFALELASQTWLKHASPEENNKITKLIDTVSYKSAAQTEDEVVELHKSVKNEPGLANVIVGSFVDKRRRNCNYDDILNVSPLPTSYS